MRPVSGTDRIEGLAGVESVGATFPLPLDGVFLAGRYGTEAALTDETAYGQADYRMILPGYFETMGTRLLAGRTFDEADFADSAAVVVIDRRLAELTWPNESPVGKRMLIRVTTTDPQWVEVIGVVEHQRAQTLAADGRETVYFTTRYVGDPGALVYVVRSSLAPARLTDQIRVLVAEMDPLLPLADVRTMDDYVSEARAPTRFALILIGVFSIIALALAAVGLYGVIAYVVRQRTAEIGVRIAFGAESVTILGLVLRQGLGLTAIGLAIGLVAAFWVTFTRLLERPISKMIAGTRRIAANQLDVRFDFKRDDEIGILAESFNTMTARVQAHRDELRSAMEYLGGIICGGTWPDMDPGGERRDYGPGVSFQPDRLGVSAEPGRGGKDGQSDRTDQSGGRRCRTGFQPRC